MATLTFIYNRKLRIVEPLTIRRGRFGTALLVAKTRDGKTKSFNMASIVPLTQEQDDMLNGKVIVGDDLDHLS
jgi:hypothetical protein